MPAGTSSDLEVDTLIFAIGDMHDPSVGLPFGKQGYITNPDQSEPRAQYEVFDPASAKVWEGVYVAGWARNPSEGLVGIARHDGEVGASHVLKYLENTGGRAPASVQEITRFLERKGKIITKGDLPWLARAEEREARLRGLAYYNFADDASMFSAIEQAKSDLAEVDS